MKSPFFYLIPDLICSSVYQIPYAAFRDAGISVLIFDIDNTLVSYETPLPDETLQKFLFSLQDKGFQIAFVSNNSSKRVEFFNEVLQIPSFPNAKKPSKQALQPIFRHFGVAPRQTLVVGDQLLTDVFCAKRNGAMAVKVEPIEKNENSFFRFKRILEKPFLWAYERQKKGETKK